MRTRATGAILLSIAAVLAAATSAGAQVTTGEGATGRPRFSGPITGGVHGFPQTRTPVDLDSAGFVEEEYFIEGTAASYAKNGTWGEDGKWDARKAESAPYRTRVLVRRPRRAADFNGTVVVEWLNVTSRVDVDVDFGFMAEELLRGGYAWVGVSAQEVAITSTGGGQFGAGAQGLRAWDPERYGTLEHPGDDFSYDIFTQVGRALRRPGAIDPLDGLEIEQLVADGESQSAFRMLTYVNAVHPMVEVYDGFLIHSRNGTGAGITTAPEGAAPAIARVRTDLDMPVLQVLSETDLFSLGDSSPFPDARQPDSASVRTWEIAGTAHADVTYLRRLYEQGTSQFSDFLDLRGVFPVANDGPQAIVMRSAIRSLRDWVAGDGAPARAQPLEVIDGAIARDEHGNALGGIRTPHVDVPIATLTGEGAPLIGSTTPFTPEVLASLYPSHDAYVEVYRKATRRAVAKGFILRQDGRALIAQAEESDIGR
ncbi:MAG: alpha/beta hydrolase domain-containing protein [Acidimicrobiia bacterium]